MGEELSAKAQTLRAIQALPDDCSYEDMIYTLYVLESIEAGLAEAEAGKTIPHEQVVKELAEWRQSVGL